MFDMIYVLHIFIYKYDVYFEYHDIAYHHTTGCHFSQKHYNDVIMSAMVS